MMKKISRSNDPVQQSLRDRKKTWNGEASTLIAQLIAFKRGINGRGDPRAGLPPSEIKHPFPDEIASYLSNMVDRFNVLVGEAGFIIEEQERYSESRAKSKKEAGGSITASASIEKEAAGAISRWWTWVSQYPFLSDDQTTKDRIDLIYILSDLEDQINNVEYVLTGGDKDSVPHSFYSYLKFLALFENRFIRSFNKSLDRHAALFKVKVENKESIPPPPSRPTPTAKEEREDLKESKEEEIKEERIKDLIDSKKVKREMEESQKKQLRVALDEVGFIFTDVDRVGIVLAKIKSLIDLNKIKNSIGSEALIRRLTKEIKSLVIDIEWSTERGSDPLSKIHKIKSMYQRLIDELSKIAGFSSPSGSIDGILSELIDFEKVSYLTPEIQKLADKKVQRWMRRLNLSIKTDGASVLKFDTAKKLNSLSKVLNSTQDLLQDEHTVIVEVISFVLDSYKELNTISSEYISIAKTYNAELKSDRITSKVSGREISLSDILAVDRMSNNISKEINSLRIRAGSINNMGDE